MQIHSAPFEQNTKTQNTHIQLHTNKQTHINTQMTEVKSKKTNMKLPKLQLNKQQNKTEKNSHTNTDKQD